MTELHTQTDPAACGELLECLDSEHAALEGLLFKLRQQYDVLSSGQHRWLGPATSEVASALEHLNSAGLRRERCAAALHLSLGLPRSATLGDLADRVTDELSCQLIHQRKREMRDVLDQVRRCSRRNRALLAHGLAATSDALTLLGNVPTYDSAGALAAGAGRPRMLDTRA